MRRIFAAAAFFLLCMPIVAAEDVRDPASANQLLRIASVPGLAPGESGELRFRLTNPYQGEMRDVALNTSIYSFVLINQAPRPVDNSWREPYFQESGEQEASLTLDLAGGLRANRTLTVVSATDTPSGGPFSQGTYFVRFWMEFDFVQTNGSVEHYRMASRGYFSDEAWALATREPELSDEAFYRGGVNLTLLGVDGVLVDTAFSLTAPIPVWPFYLLVGLFAFCIFLAAMFYIEEHPGHLPRVERAWLVLKGRFRQIVKTKRI